MNRTEAETLVTELASAAFGLGLEYGREAPGAYQKEQELRKQIIDALCSSQTVITQTAETVTGTLIGATIGSIG